MWVAVWECVEEQVQSSATIGVGGGAAGATKRAARAGVEASHGEEHCKQTLAKPWVGRSAGALQRRACGACSLATMAGCLLWGPPTGGLGVGRWLLRCFSKNGSPC